MKGLQILVIVLGVMILFATTALVILVIKKSNRAEIENASNASNANNAENQAITQTKNQTGNYITSYGVGNNLAVVLDQGNGKKIINLYDGKSLKFISSLVLGK